MGLAAWKVIGSRYIVRDRWLTLRADRCETAAGVVLDPYYVQEPNDWVQIVAFDRNDRILVTRQYRHGAGRVCTELPCGVVDRGESPVEAAARELLEETGCTVEKLEPLPVFSPNPACYANRIHAFVASGTQVEQQPRLDASEEIEFEFLTPNQILALIDSGAFSQALHVASLLLSLRYRGLLRAQNALDTDNPMVRGLI